MRRERNFALYIGNAHARGTLDMREVTNEEATVDRVEELWVAHTYIFDISAFELEAGYCCRVKQLLRTVGSEICHEIDLMRILLQVWH
jgi:hypothetical protein